MAGDLCAQDFIGWTEQQARLLRDAAGRATRLPLDWENLAEEVTDWGLNHYHAVASQVRRVIIQLLKLEFSAAQSPRRGWRNSVRGARTELTSLLRRDPGLKPRLTDLLAEEAEPSASEAAADLADCGEDDAAAAVRRNGGRYTEAQVLGDWFPG